MPTSSAVVAFRRVSLLACSAVMIVTASAACTVSVKPQDKSNDVAAPSPLVADTPPPIAVAAQVAAPAQRPISQPAAAAPTSRVLNTRGIGESCVIGHSDCRLGLYCSSARSGSCQPLGAAPKAGSSGTFASGRVCALDSSCASRVCVRMSGSAFGKCT
jgi:hypothetical protein